MSRFSWLNSTLKSQAAGHIVTETDLGSTRCTAVMRRAS